MQKSMLIKGLVRNDVMSTVVRDPVESALLRLSARTVYPLVGKSFRTQSGHNAMALT